MIRSTAITAAAGVSMAFTGGGVAWSIAGFAAGNHKTWLGACAVAGCAGAAGLYLLGRAHEAARNERGSHR